MFVEAKECCVLRLDENCEDTAEEEKLLFEVDVEHRIFTHFDTSLAESVGRRESE